MANPLLTNGTGSPQSIYVGDTTKWHPLGTKGVLDDRVFYYARQPASGTAVFRGYLYSGAAQDANFLRRTTTGAAGSFNAVMTSAATPAANAYNDGTLGINTPVNPGSGGQPTGSAGYMFKIKQHDIAAAPTFTLFDPIPEALSGTLNATTTPNWYSAVTITPGTAVVVNYAGVPQCNLTAASLTADTFFWIQTSGPTFAAVETTTVAGDTLTAAAGAAADAGCLTTLITTTATKLPPVVGYCVSVITDEEFGLVWLTIRG